MLISQKLCNRGVSEGEGRRGNGGDIEKWRGVGRRGNREREEGGTVTSIPPHRGESINVHFCL
jgi:hypothetical protein